MTTISFVTHLVIFSQDIYCGGYSGEDPPLPIPNREVKLTIADGTAPPGGRVGSCHESYDTLSSVDDGVFSLYAQHGHVLTGESP